jgi:hypothetical protein
MTMILGFKNVFGRFDVQRGQEIFFFSKTAQTVAGAQPAAYSKGNVFLPGCMAAVA